MHFYSLEQRVMFAYLVQEALHAHAMSMHAQHCQPLQYELRRGWLEMQIGLTCDQCAIHWACGRAQSLHLHCRSAAQVVSWTLCAAGGARSSLPSQLPVLLHLLLPTCQSY